MIRYNNYKYRESSSVKNGDVVWPCLGKTCKASVRTDKTKMAIYVVNELHSGQHPVTIRAGTPNSPHQNRRLVVSTPETDKTPLKTNGISKHTPSMSQTPSTQEQSHNNISPVSPVITTPGQANLADEAIPSMGHDTPTLTELLSPYITLKPVPPTYSKLDEENTYLRQKVAELEYIKTALTDKLITLEGQLAKLNNSKTLNNISTTASQTDETYFNTNLASRSEHGINPILKSKPNDLIDNKVTNLKNDSSQKHKLSDSAIWYRLPDEDIQLYMDRIKVPRNTLVLEPSVSHLLKRIDNVEEVNQLLNDLSVDSYDYVLAPVNDRSDDSKEGGAHWSLLMYTRDTDTYYHLDSLEPLNSNHAEQMAARLSGDKNVSVVRLRCCRQKSDVECGAYMLKFIDIVCSRIQNRLPIHDGRCFMQVFSINKIYATIDSIKNLSKTINTGNKVTKKVVILSDSHGRGLRHSLQGKLGQECLVTSVIKPNATLEMVTSGLEYEASKLGSNDHLVVLGGTNNLNHMSKFNVQKSVREIASKTKHTNVVICTIPYRYDRPDLNNKIRHINMNLVIESLKYEHIKLLSLSNVHINNYTNKGIHFNKWGKKALPINCK